MPNIQILRLYRDVLKFTNEFYWNNEKGQCWKDILRKSARREFDLSKDQTDNIHIMKMIVTTRQAISRTREQMFKVQFQLNKTV